MVETINYGEDSFKYWASKSSECWTELLRLVNTWLSTATSEITFKIMFCYKQPSKHLKKHFDAWYCMCLHSLYRWTYSKGLLEDLARLFIGIERCHPTWLSSNPSRGNWMCMHEVSWVAELTTCSQNLSWVS